MFWFGYKWKTFKHLGEYDAKKQYNTFFPPPSNKKLTFVLSLFNFLFVCGGLILFFLTDLGRYTAYKCSLISKSFWLSGCRNQKILLGPIWEYISKVLEQQEKTQLLVFALQHSCCVWLCVIPLCFQCQTSLWQIWKTRRFIF